jgi:hypothetical protein
MKLFNSRKLLVLGGLLIVTLAAGCAGGPGGAPYGYNPGNGSAYPYNGGAYVAPAPYPYRGYQPAYPAAGVYPNPSYYNQYQQNRLTYDENYQRNLQTYDRDYQKNLEIYNQQHPNNQVHPYNQQNAYNQQHPYNQQHSYSPQHPYNQQNAHNRPNQQYQQRQEHPEQP